MSAKQSEFRLGPVGVVEGGRIACQGCGYDFPPGARVCPVCGFERAPYPGGTFQRYDWVFSQRIDATAKLVLIALVSHDRPNGKGVFPSHNRLAEMTSLSRRAVINALARLETAGWITWDQTRRRGRQTSNRYKIQQAEMLGARGALRQGARGAH